MLHGMQKQFYNAVNPELLVNRQTKIPLSYKIMLKLLRAAKMGDLDVLKEFFQFQTIG